MWTRSVLHVVFLLFTRTQVVPPVNGGVQAIGSDSLYGHQQPYLPQLYASMPLQAPLAQVSTLFLAKTSKVAPFLVTSQFHILSKSGIGLMAVVNAHWSRNTLGWALHCRFGISLLSQCCVGVGSRDNDVAFKCFLLQQNAVTIQLYRTTEGHTAFEFVIPVCAYFSRKVNKSEPQSPVLKKKTKKKNKTKPSLIKHGKSPLFEVNLAWEPEN